MKKILIVLMLVQMVSAVQAKTGVADPDSASMAERQYYYNKYRSVRDTMRLNTWINLKRLSDNLEQVVKRDQPVLDFLNMRIAADSAVIAQLRDSLVNGNGLAVKYDDLTSEARSERTLILYLKTATGVLLFVALLLIFMLSGKASKAKALKNHADELMLQADERQQQIDMLDTEVRRLKQRELEFREELERGMQTYQERLSALQEQTKTLERENQTLRKSIDSSGGGEEALKMLTDSAQAIQELPENADDLRQLVRSLFEERSSLINLAGKLRMQAENESHKTQAIIDRINQLLNDLPG